MSNQQIYTFSMLLTAQECREYYQGLYTSVKVISDVGKSLQFPASFLRPYMTNSGIKGRFSLCLDSNNKFISLDKIS